MVMKAMQPYRSFGETVHDITNWKNAPSTALAIILYYYLLWNGLMFQVVLLVVLGFLGQNYLYSERVAYGLEQVFAKRVEPVSLLTPGPKPKRSVKEKIGRIYEAGYKMQTRAGGVATILEKVKK